ncbi:MAG TPA: hypothetical protein VEP89_02910, partial [Draconibacterium sp.]|nr:hypothetical protein [Draconibacterium sp.]
MSKRLNTDDSVKRRLDDFSVAPPPHVWNNIQTQMDARRKKRRIVYISWISGAAVVVLAFIAGWYFNAKTNDEQPVLAEQQITSDTNNTIEQTIQQETKTEAEDDIPVTENEILFAELKDEASTTKALSKENSFVLPVSGEYDEAISNSDRKIEVEGRQNYSLLKQIGAIISVEKLNLTLAEIDQPKQQNEILLADGALIAQNLKNLKEQKANERGWIVGASVSPGYSSHAANHNDTYARNMSYDSNNGGANVGAGVSVQYKTSKRLRVESGIYYAKDGQKSNNSFSMFGFKNDLEYSAAPDASYDGSAPAFS